ncbi:hypothetical protein YC2023_060303 [Brassica napus]
MEIDGVNFGSHNHDIILYRSHWSKVPTSTKVGGGKIHCYWLKSPMIFSKQHQVESLEVTISITRNGSWSSNLPKGLLICRSNGAWYFLVHMMERFRIKLLVHIIVTKVMLFKFPWETYDAGESFDVMVVFYFI